MFSLCLLMLFMLVQNLVSLHSYIFGRVSTWSCFVCVSFSVFLDSSCWGFTRIFIWNTWVLWSSISLFLCVRIFRFCHPCYTDTMNKGKVSLFSMSRRRINDMKIKCPLMLQSGSQKVWWTVYSVPTTVHGHLEMQKWMGLSLPSRNLPSNEGVKHVSNMLHKGQ